GEPRGGWHVAAVVPGAPRLPANVRAHSVTRSDGTFEFEDIPVEALAILAGEESSPTAFADARELASIEPRPGERNDLGDVLAPDAS
ncbi:MAG: hypothetical protein AAF721_39235, partial [Myxococcota bacterium]